jgi:hypothetical protein
VTGEYQRHVELANAYLDRIAQTGSQEQQRTLALRAQVHATLAQAEQLRGQNVLGLMAQAHKPTDMTGLGFEGSKALMEWYAAQSMEVADIADVPPIKWPKTPWTLTHSLTLIGVSPTGKGWDFDYDCTACGWTVTIKQTVEDRHLAAGIAQQQFDKYHEEKYGREG